MQRIVQKRSLLEYYSKHTFCSLKSIIKKMNKNLNSNHIGIVVIITISYVRETHINLLFDAIRTFFT